MKRGLCALFLAVGVLFLFSSFCGSRIIPFAHISIHEQLGIDRYSVRTNSFPPGAELCGPRILHSLGVALAHRNFSRPSLDFGSDGPPWLDDRGPPGPNACSQGSLTSCKAAGQVGSLRGNTFQRNSGPPEGKFKTRGFATPFS